MSVILISLSLSLSFLPLLQTQEEECPLLLQKDPDLSQRGLPLVADQPPGVRSAREGAETGQLPQGPAVLAAPYSPLSGLVIPSAPGVTGIFHMPHTSVTCHNSPVTGSPGSVWCFVAPPLELPFHMTAHDLGHTSCPTSAQFLPLCGEKA